MEKFSKVVIAGHKVRLQHRNIECFNVSSAGAFSIIGETGMAVNSLV